jgi:hypothetical protein
MGRARTYKLLFDEQNSKPLSTCPRKAPPALTLINRCPGKKKNSEFAVA